MGIHPTKFERAASERSSALRAAACIDEFNWANTLQGHEYWSKVFKNLRYMGQKPKPKFLPRDERMTLYGSPDTPAGYDTVLGFLARSRDDRLSADPASTQHDGFWLASQCAKRGIQTVKVIAPHVLKEYNIFYVNSYPVALLKERFGRTVSTVYNRTFTGCGPDADARG